MRLFAAIDLDDSSRAAIRAEQKRIGTMLGESRERIRWVRPEQMHLTLVFLGEVSESSSGSVVDAMSQPVPKPPFDLTFQGVGVFPERGSPRALWIGVVGGAPELIALQQDVARRIAACDVALENRAFRPHLTLGRWRDGRPSDRRTVRASSQSSVIARVRVSAATLYHSRLSPAGSTYTALARATLSEC